jgi:hypothetical protein
MLENPGVYIGGDSQQPELVVPVMSKDGKVFRVVLNDTGRPVP